MNKRTNKEQGTRNEERGTRNDGMRDEFKARAVKDKQKHRPSPVATVHRSSFIVHRSSLLLLALLVVAPAWAQSPALLPLGDTLLTLPTSHIPADGTFEVKFTHRFNQSLSQGSFSDQIHSLFGLDSNADVGFGFSYARTPALQFSLTRSNTNDAFEGSAKYLMIQEAERIPLSIALRGGAVWRTEREIRDRTSVFVQAILSRQIGSRVEIFAMPTYVTHAGRTVSQREAVALFDHAFNVPLGVAVMIRPALSLIAELTPPNQDLPPDMDGSVAWALGLKRAVGGHYFEVLITNSNATQADQYVTSTYQGTPLAGDEVHLGFNIERRFGRRPARR
ncbi:MAG TPA: DUF5777 family beta-barrel protein [Thermoanaerobaculia bacterium]|nr:DUF5777 family beta-barrel protein [Thermoanaerobaculia bacterium]